MSRHKYCILIFKNNIYFSLYNLRDSARCILQELQQNHRQGKDVVYADILNRIRFANHTENDMELLRARVSQSLPVEAIHLFGTNAEVNNFNEQRLDEMEGKLIELPGINIHPTIESYKPHVSKDGRVHESPLLSIVKLVQRMPMLLNLHPLSHLLIPSERLGNNSSFVLLPLAGLIPPRRIWALAKTIHN